jgi:DNA-binding response OmpR family regulator
MTWPQYLRGECTASGFRVKLSRLQTELLSTLMLRYPNPVKAGELIEAVWPDDNEPDSSNTGLGSLIRDLRLKLGGFRIISHRSFGYRLAQRREDNEA